MKRGDIYFAVLDPGVGKEVRKKRPVAIVSNDDSNEEFAYVTVVPLTSNVSKVHRFEVKVSAKRSGLPKDSKALPQHIRTISKQRLVGPRAGAITADDSAALDTAIKLHLDLG